MTPDSNQDTPVQEAGLEHDATQIEDLELDEKSSGEVAGGCATGKHIEADGTLVG